MLRERTFWTLLLTGLALAAFFALQGLAPDRFAWLHTADIDAADSVRFWYERLHRPAWRADVLILGDSRVNQGISPALMRPLLDDRSIELLAFPGGGLTVEMFALADERLDSMTRPPVVALGVTPSSLTRRAAHNRAYHAARDRGKMEYLKARWFGWLAEAFPRMQLRDLRRLALGEEQPRERLEVVYHDDGWVETTMTPPRPGRALEEYAGIFAVTRVSEDLCRALFEQVRRWTAQGVAVFGFRPPTSAALVELEDRSSGFSPSWFRREFERAGGVWIEVDPEGYVTYDGGHLLPESARRFSRDLARAMAARLDDRVGDGQP